MSLRGKGLEPPLPPGDAVADRAGEGALLLEALSAGLDVDKEAVRVTRRLAIKSESFKEELSLVEMDFDAVVAGDMLAVPKLMTPAAPARRGITSGGSRATC